MAGWHYQLSGREFEQALRVGKGRWRVGEGKPWAGKDSDTIEQLNWTERPKDQISYPLKVWDTLFYKEVKPGYIHWNKLVCE